MRLTDQQTRRILDITHRFLGDEVEVVLFGSRTDAAARGGDIDLFVETPEPVACWRRAQLLAALERELDLPCDLVVHVRGEAEKPIHRIARLSGIALS